MLVHCHAKLWEDCNFTAQGACVCEKAGSKCAEMEVYLQVLMIDVEKRAVVVKGSVPGKPGCAVEVTPNKVVGKNC